MKGWGRVTALSDVVFQVSCPGSVVPPGYQLFCTVDPKTAQVGDVVEYEIVPTPTAKGAELRRLYPCEPEVGGIH